MSFFYAILLKLLYPTSLCVILLLVAALYRKRQKVRRICFCLAMASLMVCGNGWVVKYSTRYLESQYPPLSSPSSVPADCILVLGGGTSDKIPPRPTVEVGEAGDRILYAAHLFKAGRAQRILCTSGIATGSIGLRPAADNMAELLQDLGVPESAIVRETASSNTHEHGRNLLPMLKQKGFNCIILVTSASHMPRSMGVFRKSCPGIEFIPAPTDFRIVEFDLPWYRELVNLIPTPSNLVQFSETMHEYLGMAYYRLRGWL